MIMKLFQTDTHMLNVNVLNGDNAHLIYCVEFALGDRPNGNVYYTTYYIHNPNHLPYGPFR